MIWAVILVAIAALTIRLLAGKAALISLLVYAGVGFGLMIGVVVVGFLFSFGWGLAQLMFEEQR